MSEWSAGYVADIGYTYGYYTELNPLRIRMAFLNAGLVFPEVGHACELGFGQGLSVNLHAAASLAEWHGTDFNPSQAGFAQEMATASGAKIQLRDQAFAEFCARDDLPEFDSIGLHGIWSWISDENRHIIVDFIRRKLKVGGVLYISYNTQPGWASMVPVRDLLTEYNEVMGAPGKGIAARIGDSLDFASKLFATNPSYSRINPQVVERINKMKEQNRSYVAHEYFNRDWLPMSFADMARWMEPAKLNYACSTHYLDHIENINMNEAQRALINEITDPMFKETVRDFMVNQQFRRDYWVRGSRKLAPLEQADQIREQRVMLAVPRADVALTVMAGLGEASLQEAVYCPILDVLADYKPRTIAKLEQMLVGQDIKFAQLVQAVFVLLGANTLQAVQEDAVINKARIQTDKLNSYICRVARSRNEINYLASPVTGGAVTVTRIGQLFLLARALGRKTPAEWAKYAADVFTQQGQRILKEGKMVETAEDELAELTAQAEKFAEKMLPVLKGVGIIS
ncbi:methyltransferase [Duganella sp. CY15W]|uniref:class I SAM-dependent methyltransferase n=1 Tax=Duganella sp. CY15W TaxID=2692172 RepID=UPI00136C0928|nr:class I SAM-dependent methyltransferase [Duganella sp. CY15W]MYM30250.1 methyltransferase [Duganella sp. CY15W]